MIKQYARFVLQHPFVFGILLALLASSSTCGLRPAFAQESATNYVRIGPNFVPLMKTLKAPPSAYCLDGERNFGSDTVTVIGATIMRDGLCAPDSPGIAVQKNLVPQPRSDMSCAPSDGELDMFAESPHAARVFLCEDGFVLVAKPGTRIVPPPSFESPRTTSVDPSGTLPRGPRRELLAPAGAVRAPLKKAGPTQNDTSATATCTALRPALCAI